MKGAAKVEKKDGGSIEPALMARQNKDFKPEYHSLDYHIYLLKIIDTVLSHCQANKL